MKFKSILFVLGTMTMVSCNKGFLEEKPYSFLSADALFNTDAGAKSVVTGAWGVISGGQAYGSNYNLVLDLASGGWYNTARPYQDINKFTFTSSSPNLNDRSPYNGFYTAIIRANDIIDALPAGKVSQGVKDNLLGQAYLIRGMAYFNLVRMHGGVPLRLLPVNADNVDLPRATKNEVYDQVILDLEKAKDLLPLKAIQEKGRPAKYAAYALLGKVYIAMAGADNASPFWEKAKTELLAVKASNEYSLVNNFASLWGVSNPNTNESIIEIQYSLLGVENSMSNFYTPTRSTFTPIVTNGPFGRHRPNKESYSFHAARYPTDPRINATYIYNQYEQNGGSIIKVWPSNKTGQGFPYMKKYIDPGFISRTTNCNFIYLRYADVLLSLAEVENEINGPTDAYQYVNEVLTRARNSASPAATTPANYAGLIQNNFRTRILLERRYELMGEVHLWFDTRRKGEDYLFNFLTEHNNFSINGGLNLSFDTKYELDSKYMLLPIPAAEINANILINPSDQNPGY
jgi:hypothetical protein